MQANSVYEAWVRTLRAWALDPTLDLSGLPAFSESDMPPIVFERFVTHVKESLQTFNDRWMDLLGNRIGQAPDQFTKAQIFVDAKRMLARRLLLARHPGLPQSMRNALWENACTDIRSMQKQLEQLASKPGNNLDTSGREAAFYREHALTSLIADGFPLEAFVAGQYQEPSTAVTMEATNQQAPSGFTFGHIKPRVLPILPTS